MDGLPSSYSTPNARPKRTTAAPLRERTSSRNALNGVASSAGAHASPPSTPQNPRKRDNRRNNSTPLGSPSGPKGKAPAAVRAQKENVNVTQQNRHSHGLTWNNSTTRDSVVDNLLLSLDNLSTPGTGGMETTRAQEVDFDTSKYRFTAPDIPSLPSRTMQRPRGHTYSSSLSSDYDRHGASELSSPSTYSAHVSPQGRRSNSSSNIDPLRDERMRPAKHFGRSSSETQKQGSSAITPGVCAAGARVDEEDPDNELLLEARRLAFNGRSVSMDHIYSQDPNKRSNSILGRGRPVPSAHGSRQEVVSPDPAACPEPGVPAGPRKMLNPQATGPVYVGQAPKASALRKTTTQSDLRSSSTATPAILREIRDQANDFVRASSMRGDPPTPATASHRQYSAESPNHSMRGRKEASTSPQTQERPGFFKRVFGGGSTRISSGLFEHADFIGGTTRLKSPLGATNSSSKQSAKENSNNAANQSLNKKPSSFFRRRKKSTNDSVALPSGLPVANQPKEAVSPAEVNPSDNSLRKFLDPYLSPNAKVANNNTEAGGANDLERPSTKESTSTDSDLDLFHTGYSPPPDASLGRRNPISREMSQSQEDDKHGDRVRLRLRKRMSAQNMVSHNMDKSFLHDASREPSSATLGERFRTDEQEMVSPVSETRPSVEAEHRPVSRASTGDRIIAMKASGSNGEAGAVRRLDSLSRERETFDSNGPHSAARTIRPSRYDDEDNDEEEWGIVAPPRSAGQDSSRSSGSRSTRLFLQPTTSEEEAKLHGPPKVNPKVEEPGAASDEPSGTREDSLAPPCPPSSQSHSTSSLPLMQVNSTNIRESVEFGRAEVPDTNQDAEPRERARKIYEGNEEDVPKNEAASWLGERKVLSMRTLEAYMQLFDFSDQNILSALRTLCGKLILRGETQQFDRIVTALSSRWCECNQNHGFKAQDVVHTICYSLILLNTDLHLADIGDKMSRTAYVKNTLPTVKRVLADAAPGAFDDASHAGRKDSRPNIQRLDSSPSVPSSPVFPPNASPGERSSFDLQRPQASKRLSLRPGMLRTESDGWTPDGTASNALVSSSIEGNLRSWEAEVETVLKSFFGSIRTEPLPLFGANIPGSASQNTLTAGNLGLKRSGSVSSKAPSDNASYRSKGDLRSMTMRWQSRNSRSRPRLYPSSTVASSSRTSLDDGNSVWSPAQSSTWSKYSFGKTLTSSSLGSLGQHYSPGTGDYKHSIGFANALSQAIIREEGTSAASIADTDSFGMGSASMLDDEALALEGAPWAKEALVTHKHHLESLNHKAKERSWNKCFAVIGKGKLTLFNFNTSSKAHSINRKHQGNGGGNANKGGRAASTTSTHVGGGDWMESAEQLLSLSLLQTIASVLPPPGYSKARPYVWALSLPSGAVHLFQVGTLEIAHEFMTTANYWSARLSKEPLSGGVSNIEYGWSEAVVDPALLADTGSHSAATLPPGIQNQQHGHMHSLSNGSMSNAPGARRSSMQSSLRTSFEAQFSSDRRVRLPGDKVQIQEWTPPSQSMVASQLDESDQLKALQTYVDGVEEELARHNELKDGIELAFSPRHPNRAKALTNWQRKSDYLLREIVKFRTYIDSLHAAQKARNDYEARKNPEKAASLAPPASEDGRDDEKGGGDRDVTPRQLAEIFAPIRRGEGEEDVDGDRDVTPRASRGPPPREV